jgi:hypothetical protein
MAVLTPREALLLCCGNDVPVGDDCRRWIVKDSINTKDSQKYPLQVDRDTASGSPALGSLPPSS